MCFGAALAPIRLGPTLSGYWTIGGRILFAALVGWMALSLVGALRHIVELRSDISVADNLRARRRRTRVRILHRIAQFVIGFITVSVMLVEIGRAHVCTPVTNAHLVCRLLLYKNTTLILEYISSTSIF